MSLSADTRLKWKDITTITSTSSRGAGKLQKEREDSIFQYNTKRAEVEKYVSSLKNLDTLDDISFDGELLKFFNIFKDAHTSYYIPYRYLDKQLFFIENKVLLKHEGKYKEVLSIGNMPINCFITKNIDRV